MGDAQRQSGLTSTVFFLDENHCGNRQLHAVFEATGIRFEKHTDHFARGAADADWIPVVGKRGWAVLTADARIRYNRLERNAVRQHKLRLFYFSRNDFSGVEMGTILQKALPKMITLCEELKPPFAASITRNGDVAVRDEFNHH